MAGIIAFVFSTVIITFLGEIIPQAYFSRHAMQIASLLSPILRFYQFLLYPLAKPTSFILDKWLGAEAIRFFQEEDLQELLKIHMDSAETNIEKIEGKGALNFLAIDDLTIIEEGEPIDSKSVIELPFKNNKPILSITKRSCEDPFLKKIQASEKKWIILTDATGEPRLTLDSDAFIRSVLFEEADFNPLQLCQIARLKVYPERLGDDVVDEDIILFWGDEQRRIITGSDVLGRLLRGIVQQEKTAFRKIKYEET
jgi:hypothetical protein